MEIVEILKEDGSNTHISISKDDAHEKNICHGISAVALINDKGQVLIAKRALNKKTEPGKFDLSGCGHIEYEETREEAAIRELYEEIGIKVTKDELIQIDTYLNKVRLNDNVYLNHFTYLFIIKKDIDIEKIKIQLDEIDSVKYVTKDELVNLFDNNEMVAAFKHCHKLLDYLK